MCYKNIPTNQPYPGYIVPLKQWPNIPMLYQHLMRHHLSKSCGKCVDTWNTSAMLPQFMNASISQSSEDNYFFFIGPFPTNPKNLSHSYSPKKPVSPVGETLPQTIQICNSLIPLLIYYLSPSWATFFFLGFH